MARIESSMTVSRSVEEVFAFLNKCESHRSFIPRCVEFNQTSQGEFGRVGATSLAMLNYFGIRIPVDYEIIEHRADQRLAMKGRMGFADFKDGYVLASAQNHTRIDFWLELTLTGWMKVLSPFAGLLGKIHAWETLNNLKRELQADKSQQS